MFRSLPYKTNQFFYSLIKLSIVFGAGYFIYNKVINSEKLDFSVFVDFLTKNEVFSLKNVLFLCLLSVFNWFFEILKWKNLVDFLQKISFYQALKESLSALTASLFTPNRLGDYAAKILYYPTELRKRIIFLNLMANMAQMTITVVLGLIGLLLFQIKYDLEISSFKVVRMAVILLIISFLFIVSIRQNKIKIRGFSFHKIIAFFRNIHLSIHLKNLGLSLIRYLIFSYQFYLLLGIFGVEVYYLNAMVVISTMYILASIIPSIFIFDPIIKGSVAIYLFGLVGVNELTIVSIIAIMWILNFALPSIIGGFYVIRFKPSDSLKRIERL